MGEQLVRSIADTARWVAHHRAVESERPDALFHDPYARRLAGERGEEMAHQMPQNGPFIASRTQIFDELILEQLTRAPIDLVVNMAAGLDTRPYRLHLPRSVSWVEIDLPEIVQIKTHALAGEVADCPLELIAQDLSDVGARRRLFASLSDRAKNVLVLSEGLLSYLTARQVAELAADLHDCKSFRFWMVEVVSPKVINFVQNTLGEKLAEGGASMHFAPAYWRAFYAKQGWRAVTFRDVDRNLEEAGRTPVQSPTRQSNMEKARTSLRRLVFGSERDDADCSGVAILERR